MKLETNLSAHEKKLLFLLGALLAVAVSYFFIYQTNMKAVKELDVKNEEDQATVNMLEEMVSRQAEVEAETEQLQAEIDSIIAKYPTNVTPEKAILTIQDIEDKNTTHVSSISFLMNNLMGDIAAATTVDENGNEVSSGSSNNVGFYAAVSMDYEATYENLKNMVAYISALPDRTTIPSITMSYDTESGNINGVMTLNMYYLTGTSNEYVAPSPGVSSGVGDIFSSGSPAVNRAAQAEEEAQAEAAEEQENAEGN